MNEAERRVSVSGLSATLNLPDDFGDGWEYRNVRLFAQGHSYAGSYLGEELCNFAHEALSRIEGISETTICPGQCCSVTIEYEDFHEVEAMRKKLQELVDAFPPRKGPDVTVRGSNFYDSKVTLCDVDDEDDEGSAPVPLREYLVMHVPMANTHPAVAFDGVIDSDLQALQHQQEESVHAV